MSEKTEGNPFAIVSTSRAGSTWFCEVVRQAFRLNPFREDFNPNVFSLLKDETISTAEFLAWARILVLSRIRGRHPYTKLIWDNVPALLKLMNEEELDLMVGILDELKPRLIRLRRKDQIAQAVSRYIAGKTGVWHIKSKKQKKSWRHLFLTTPIQQVEYDFQKIKIHYDLLKRAEKHFDEIFSICDFEKIQINYEDFIDCPEQYLAEISELLKIEIVRPFHEINSGYEPTGSHKQHLISRFSADLTRSGATILRS